jgi:hypothetical protein
VGGRGLPLEAREEVIGVLAATVSSREAMLCTNSTTLGPRVLVPNGWKLPVYGTEIPASVVLTTVYAVALSSLEFRDRFSRFRCRFTQWREGSTQLRHSFMQLRKPSLQFRSPFMALRHPFMPLRCRFTEWSYVTSL